MTREAKEILEEVKVLDDSMYQYNETYLKALDMAISALDLINHIKDRPCSACDYNKGNGCTRWECVFDEHLRRKEKK